MKFSLNTLPGRLISAAALVLITFFLTRSCTNNTSEDQHNHAAQTSSQANAEDEVAFWTCSMDPQIKQAEFGDCPICGMDLISVMAGAAQNAGPNALRLEEGQRAMAGIRTTVVERLPARHELSLFGSLHYDETHTASLNAWVGGRLENLFVDYTGINVRAGDHMVEIYSPELFQAQQELIIAERAVLDSSADAAMVRINRATLEASQRKLQLLGLNETQIEKIIQRGEPSDRMTLFAPIGGVVVHKTAVEGTYVKEGAPLYQIADLSHLWLQIDAFESDLVWLSYGQSVSFTVDAFPGENFHGTVAFIAPSLDPTTRTVHVRVVVPNDDLRLRPEMFVRAKVLAEINGGGKAMASQLEGKWMCPMHPEVIGDGPSSCPICEMPLESAASLGFTTASKDVNPIVIPASAPLLTGERAVVFVQQQDSKDENAYIYESREIQLGPRAGAWFVVTSGLKEGEVIVSRGAFTLDSEMQLLGKQSMMSPPKETSAEEANKKEELRSSVEFQQSVGQLLTNAVAVSKAFAADDLNAAHTALAVLTESSKAVNTDSLPLGSIQQARAQLETLSATIMKVHMSKELEAARVAFEPLQKELFNLADKFGYTTSGQDVAIFHCPMAFDNRGADWLQFTGERVENPYFGSGMFRCGSETKAIPSAVQEK
jgi:membrane fusion protein, copper/silver efflux system